MTSFHPVKTIFFRRSISIALIGLGCGGIMVILLSTGLLRGVELKSLDLDNGSQSDIFFHPIILNTKKICLTSILVVLLPTDATHRWGNLNQ